MKHYVQLKDGVVFASHSSQNDVDDSGPNVWLVDQDASDKLGKLYDNGNFSDAPIIKYAVLDNDTVIQIKETLFSSEVTGPIITNNDVKVLWTWNGSEFVSPNVIAPVEVIVATQEFAPVEIQEQVTYTTNPDAPQP
jgi:hypothetical protein